MNKLNTNNTNFRAKQYMLHLYISKTYTRKLIVEQNNKKASTYKPTQCVYFENHISQNHQKQNTIHNN